MTVHYAGELGIKMVYYIEAFSRSRNKEDVYRKTTSWRLAGRVCY